MRDCPDCGAVVDGLICPKCGRRDPASETVVARLVDREHFLCSHVERGQRCANPGTLSTNTLGPGVGHAGPHLGPWFCARHFPLFRGRDYDGQQPPGIPVIEQRFSVPFGAFAALRQMLAASDGQGHDHRNWARRIIDRDTAGEPIDPHVLKAAQEALAAAVYQGPTTFQTVAAASTPAVDLEAIAEREAIRAEAIEAAKRIAGDA